MAEIKTVRVLVVDDDPEDAMILRRHFAQFNECSVEAEPTTNYVIFNSK